jgi:hypothetical protein
MAKRNQEPQTSSSRTPLIVLTIGALLVAGLVVWALTRTVEPTSVMTSATDAAAPSATPVTETSTVAGTSTTSTPIASTTAPITATSTIPPTPARDNTAVQRISAEDLREKFNAGTVTIIDVRDATSYAAGHIPGALHIPMSSIQANLDLIPKGKDVVAYCT